MSAASPDSFTPTGTVTFTLDGSPTAPQPIGLNGASAISFMLTAGSHAIGARYDGDSNYLPSSSRATIVTVDKSASVLTMASNPAQLNQAVAIRAAPILVSPATAMAGGTVEFTSGGTAIAGCTSLPVQSGVAICNTSFPRLGTFTIAANYSGNVNSSRAPVRCN